ncbi:GDYXXLXY domain-containing protein [Nostoc sp.]|uniref:GDYXXLXY domain-containing protein n=1 Tax=Nostoc sp. TaxID=1180 RepID=UPI002FF7202A
METNQALPLQNEPSKKPIALWQFVVPLLIQTAIILAVPAQSVYTLVTGKTAILQTLPVDPYDLLRGYSVTLNYQISRIDNLKKLPGWEDLVKQNPVPDKRGEPLVQGTNLYIILEEQKSSSGIPQAWKPVRVSGQFPTSLAANQIALKGQYSAYNSITYGLETYYIPEDQRNDINNDISKARSIKPGQPQPIVVEVKVNAQGKAIPINMWVRDRKYHF